MGGTPTTIGSYPEFSEFSAAVLENYFDPIIADIQTNRIK